MKSVLPGPIAVLLWVVSLAIAVPFRPGLAGPEPYYPPGVEVPGPNKLAGFDYCETVTILMHFPDNRADTLGHSPARFDSMLYSTGVYTGLPYRQGSLNDFFLENSYGNYDVRGSIAGNRWFLSQYNYSRYYDGNYMLSTGGQLARENLQQVDAIVDFRQFDLNGDGHIDAMFMVHAGADGADNGNVNCCWSHAIPYFNYTTGDGVVIDGVTNVPEFAMVTEARETTLCCIAVMCHELGHLVGLPDLYQGGRTQWGIGYWGLMGYGAWGAGGNTPWSPSHMEAWSKVRAGFVNPTVVTTNLYDVRIPPVVTDPVIYKVWRNGANHDTCFYLENRQQKGFDTPLPGPGLAIWHIDPSRSAWFDRVDMEEDSTFHLDNGWGYRPDPHVYHEALGDTSDVLPGNWNRAAFDSSTVPSSRDRNNRSTGVCVRNVRQVADTIICDIIIRPESVAIEQARPAPELNLAVHPSPSRPGVVRFELGQPANANPGATVDVAVFGVTGRQVLGAELAVTGSSVPVNLSSLRPGVYMVRVVAGDARASARLTLLR